MNAAPRDPECICGDIAQCVTCTCGCLNCVDCDGENDLTSCWRCGSNIRGGAAAFNAQEAKAGNNDGNGYSIAFLHEVNRSARLAAIRQLKDLGEDISMFYTCEVA